MIPTNPLWIGALGAALLQLVWQGALVAGLLALALQIAPARAARLRYALGCSALLAMLILPAITFAQAWAVLHAASAHFEGSAAFSPNAFARDAAEALQQPGASGFVARWSRIVAWTAQHAREIVLLWALGVLLSSLRVLGGWVRLMRITRLAVPVGAEWEAALARLTFALKLSRPVRLLASAQIDVPAAAFVLKPVVLIPISALTGLPTAQLELILAHELAHIRRHDYAVNLLQTAAETLLFHHPAVWWIGRVIRAERENCCDDLALATGSGPLIYARALTALESLRHLQPGARSMAMASGLAPSALGGSLAQRVHRMVLPETRCSSSWSIGASAASVLFVLALAIPAAATALPKLQDKMMRAEKPARQGIAEPVAEVAADEPGQLTVDQIVALHNAGVDGARVNGYRTAFRKDLGVEKIIQLAHAGVTPESAHALSVAFGDSLDLDQVIRMHHLGVTPEYVETLSALGFRDLSPETVTQARTLGVSEDYAEEMKQAGVLPRELSALMRMRALGIDAGWLAGLRSAGYGKLSLEELQSIRALGIDGDYVKEMKGAGLGKLSIEDLKRLRVHGITPEYLQALREK
jgi:beta-lactamase regulating signal transducer with metallopeptidase domain